MTDTTLPDSPDQPATIESVPPLTIEQELHFLRSQRLASRVPELSIGDPAHVAVVDVVQDIFLRTEGI